MPELDKNKVPVEPNKIFENLRGVDITQVDISRIRFGELRSAVEWVFYVGNDWLDHEGYWTRGEHWGGKTSQRNLAFIEFLHGVRLNGGRGSMKDYLYHQLPALSGRFSEGQIQDIVNLMHLFIVAESVNAISVHMAELLKNQGEIYSADRNQFNHNGFTGHGAGPNSERYGSEFHPVPLVDKRTMRYL